MHHYPAFSRGRSYVQRHTALHPRLWGPYSITAYPHWKASPYRRGAEALRG